MKLFKKIIISLYFASMALSLASPSPALAGSASINLSASTNNCKVGASVTITASVNSGGQAINAAEGTINYTSDVLSYVSHSTGGSIFSFWTKGPTAGSESTTFGGGLADPGYNGSSGKIISITFKAKKEGSVTFSISGGKVLANDGEGTNVIGGTGTTTVTVGANVVTPSVSLPTIKSVSHPDQDQWYSERNVQFSWSGGTGATGYAYTFDQNAGSEPRNTSFSNQTQKTFENVSDGLWYLAVKAKTATGFLSVVRYKVHIDGTAPDEFITVVDQDGRPENPRPKAIFNALDGGSGIKSYSARIDDGEAFTPVSGEALPKQRPGKHKITITATDNAGNTRESTANFLILGIDPPLITIKKDLVNLLDPICFEGYAGQSDTISVFLDSETVVSDSFVASSALANPKTKIVGLGNPPAGQVPITFCYSKLILPGEHSFMFARTTVDGAESGLTNKIKVKVEAATVKILNYIIPIRWIILLLLILIILLILLIIYLIKKLRDTAKKTVGHIAKSGKLILTITRYLKGVIKKDLPDKKLTKQEVNKAREELTSDIDKIESKIKIE